MVFLCFGSKCMRQSDFDGIKQPNKSLSTLTLRFIYTRCIGVFSLNISIYEKWVWAFGYKIEQWQNEIRIFANLYFKGGCWVMSTYAHKVYFLSQWLSCTNLRNVWNLFYVKKREGKKLNLWQYCVDSFALFAVRTFCQNEKKKMMKELIQADIFIVEF